MSLRQPYVSAGDGRTRVRGDGVPSGQEAMRPTQMQPTFIIISKAGANRDLSKGTREQPYWDEHAAFIDELVDSGFVLLGGPLVDEGGAILVVYADGEDEVREKMKDDPWYQHDVLEIESIKRWEIFIDQRS